jgi:hypothetical protein
MSKYAPLHEFLSTRGGGTITLTFDQIDQMVGALPRRRASTSCGGSTTIDLTSTASRGTMRATQPTPISGAAR